MSSFQIVLEKLEGFIRKFYINELIKGFIIFCALATLSFLIVTFIEYFFWLNTVLRAFMFWLFVCFSFLVFIKYIVIPISKLFKFRNGISKLEAAAIIGNHFPEVEDKLANVLELSTSNNQSDLVVAGIEQKAKQLSPVPFKLAINFGNNTRFLKWLLVPVVLFVLLWTTGNISAFFSSFNRVQQYGMHFTPPAPFEFVILNNSLSVKEKEEFRLLLTTKGSVKPNTVSIVFGDKKYMLPSQKEGFYFNFPENLKKESFYLLANGVRSPEFKLELVLVPTIQSIKIYASYPSYINKRNETFENNGSVTVPEGTRLKWEIKSKNTNAVWFVQDTINSPFVLTKNSFDFNKKVFNNFQYGIKATSLETIDTENLNYNVEVIKDEFPKISMQMVADSIQPNIRYFVGEVMDDYGVQTIELVYYPYQQSHLKKELLLKRLSGVYNRFYYTYPNELNLEEGKAYSFYFRVKDNDGVHGGKFSNSEVFSFTNLSTLQVERLQLEQQKNAIDNMSKSLQDSKISEQQLESIRNKQKQQKSLDFNDKKEIKDFVRRKSLQEEQMKKFSKQLQQNLEENTEESEFKELLKERLKRQEEAFKKSQKLLEELDKLTDKIKDEELQKKVEKLSKQNSNSKRNLEQILELTKRYYVTQKLSKLQKELEQLAKEQTEKSKDSSENNNVKSQDALNKKFENFLKEMDSLKKLNKNLKKPLSIKNKKEKNTAIKSDQNQAKDLLKKSTSNTPKDNSSGNNKEQNNSSKEQQPTPKEEKPTDNTKSNARKKQKSAGDKMKQMSEGLKQNMMQASGGESMQEDIEMLRQILDNLVVFSKEEEALMQSNSRNGVEDRAYALNLRKQKQLKEAFTHVDDSLLALSMRQPMIGEEINKEITEVYYNIDRALEFFADNNSNQGIARQQFVVSSSNALASMLANSLNSMQMQMNASGSGSGNGGGPQLPDIIQSQEELSKGAGKSKGSQSGNEGSDKKDGKEPGKEEGTEKGGKSEEENGNDTKDGEKGKEGKDGKDGPNGENREKGNKGKNGQKPSNGEGEGNNQGGNGSNEEMEMEKLYQIYQEQQRLRNALEKQLEDMKGSGERSLTKNIIKQMENVEDRLLQEGYHEGVKKQMNKITHQLLKLKKASHEQGEDSKRTGYTNKERYEGKIINKNPFLKKYLEQIELLNRQILPLQNRYKNKVKNYFKDAN